MFQHRDVQWACFLTSSQELISIVPGCTGVTSIHVSFSRDFTEYGFLGLVNLFLFLTHDESYFIRLRRRQSTAFW